jgi:hypothetical protein
MAVPQSRFSEEWRSVPGFEGLYDVSSDGRVKRVGRAARTGKSHGGGARIGRILKDAPNGDYRKVQLWRDGQWFNFQVHQLVAAAFIGPCPSGQEVNHDDGVKSNNNASNLEYLTRSGNMRHAYRTGLRKANPVFGERHHAATLSSTQINDLLARRIRDGTSYRKLAAIFGIHISTASRICTGRSRTRG